MNRPRLAELARRRAAIFEELALLERAIADELVGASAEAAPAPANDVKPRHRRRRRPAPPATIPELTRKRAKRTLRSMGEDE